VSAGTIQRKCASLCPTADVLSQKKLKVNREMSKEKNTFNAPVQALNYREYNVSK
jgi:hypothetical protein